MWIQRPGAFLSGISLNPAQRHYTLPKNNVALDQHDESELLLPRKPSPDEPSLKRAKKEKDKGSGGAAYLP
jgi:hypothetical protein